MSETSINFFFDCCMRVFAQDDKAEVGQKNVCHALAFTLFAVDG
jgi:hypothetical protein